MRTVQTGASPKPDAAIRHLTVSAYDVPTDSPESDGTLAWDKTTLVIVELEAEGTRALGYTYANQATAALIDSLADVVRGRDALDTAGIWAALVHRIRNLGRPGICSMAVAAIDNALWDLKARLLGLPLVKLLGAAHEGVQAYGSGGFTSYSIEQLLPGPAPVGTVMECITLIRFKSKKIFGLQQLMASG
jgi:L-alanine-DL-glutamate epimerase-like enolase superfamily enzyme